MGAMAVFECFPDFPLEACDLSVPSKCTTEEPEIGSKCSGIGINCDYGYAYTDCTPEEATCSATKSYTCEASLPIDCGDTEPPIGDTCDPSSLECPLVLSSMVSVAPTTTDT
jgi:hypothetical protein